jgi:multidrug resistance protein, MATE family
MSTTTSTTNNHSTGLLTWKQEVRLLLELVGPTCLINFGGFFPNFLIASHVGRAYGSISLDGFTLAILTGNLCTFALLEGLYSAADTLSPQAFGAGNYREVGLLAIRGYLASLLVLAPINLVLVFYFGTIMVKVGEDPQVARVAHEWYRVYCMAYPFYALYKVTVKFLSAQHIMKPLIWNSVLCCGVVLPLVLTIDTQLFGFIGTAIAVDMYLVAQAAVLLGLVKWNNHRSPEKSLSSASSVGGTAAAASCCWPGLSWELLRDALQWEPFRLYFALGVGGMLATSEWIFWEMASLLIGTMGVLPLSVHTIPNQVLFLGCMIPFGIGTALAVRLGIVLPRSVKQAQHLTLASLIGSALIVGLITLWMYLDRARVFSIFTSEPEVLAGCERVWWKVCVLYLNLGLFGVNTGVATGLGMQWLFGAVTLICLWVVSLPGIYYFAIVKGGGLDVAYTWIFTPYVFMNIYLAYVFWSLDWHKIQIDIRIREGMDDHRDEDRDEDEDDDDGDNDSDVLVVGEEELVPTRTSGGLANESTSLLSRPGHHESSPLPV